MSFLLTNSYSFSKEKIPKKGKMNSAVVLPFINNYNPSNTESNTLVINQRYHHRHRSHRKKSKKMTTSYISTEPSFNFTINKLRRDIYGNLIEKGGEQKVSFKDHFKGKKLVETTVIDLKKSVINQNKKNRLSRSIDKIDKNDIIKEESKDKEEITCSSTCYIF